MNIQIDSNTGIKAPGFLNDKGRKTLINNEISIGNNKIEYIFFSFRFVNIIFIA